MKKHYIESRDMLLSHPARSRGTGEVECLHPLQNKAPEFTTFHKTSDPVQDKEQMPLLPSILLPTLPESGFVEHVYNNPVGYAGGYISDYLKRLVKKHGPDEEDYAELDRLIDKVIEYKRSGIFSEKDISLLRDMCGDAFSVDTLQGFALRKPHGYSGDFEIIDRLYQKYICPNPHFIKWDKYCQHHKATEAVRNRQKYFINVIKTHIMNEKEVEILNIGSGPRGRDMYNFFNSVHLNGNKIHFECIDQDEQAIAYAQSLCNNFLAHITFNKQNILRFKPTRKYNLIWSAGVFDYFNDRIFLRILKKLLPALEKGGEFVIGNFSANNPSKNYMEIFEWYLYHRTPEQLKELARKCGIEDKNISITTEEAGVNLFLHIKN